MDCQKQTILIAHNYTENSFAAMSFYLAKYWASKGHEIVFISYRPFYPVSFICEDYKSKIYVYSWSSMKRPNGLKDIIHFVKIYLKHRPKIVLGHFVGANISILVSKLLSFGQVQTFEYYHTLSSQIKMDFGISKYRKIRKKVFYKYFCDNVLPNSQLALQDYSNFYKLNNGIDHLTPLVDRYLNLNPGIEKKIITVGYLGRLNFSKGINLIVDSIDKLDSQKFRFKFAGDGDLEHLFHQLNFDNIEFLGNIDYHLVDEFIQSCDIIVIPSLYDNLVTVGIETLMNERCLVISNRTGLSEYLQSNYDCLKISPDTQEIVSNLNYLYHNQHIMLSISKGGRKTFLEKFTLEKYFKSMDRIVLKIND